MGEYTKHDLSGSTDGRQISIAATGTPGTLIHTATGAAGYYDEIWLEATNTAGGDRVLSIQWGGVTANDLMEIKLKKGDKGYIRIIDGNILANSLILGAFGSSANDIKVVGYVNRISP